LPFDSTTYAAVLFFSLSSGKQYFAPPLGFFVVLRFLFFQSDMFGGSHFSLLLQDDIACLFPVFHFFRFLVGTGKFFLSVGISFLPLPSYSVFFPFFPPHTSFKL